jgi:hypothetical protein
VSRRKPDDFFMIEQETEGVYEGALVVVVVRVSREVSDCDIVSFVRGQKYLGTATDMHVVCGVCGPSCVLLKVDEA